MGSSYDKSWVYRESYLRAQRTLEKSGMTVNDPSKPNTIRMAQSMLRSEIFATPGQSEFTFPILTNDPSPGSPIPTPTITEVRLKQQDVFFTCELAFYIYCQQTGGSSANPSWRYVDMTFPDPNLNGGAWSPGYSYNLAQALWTTGRLNVQVNNVTTTPLWPIKNHSYVPQTQVLANGVYLPADAVNGGDATGMELSMNPISYNENGRCNIWPNWVLNGGNNNQYTLTYPTPISNLGINSAAKLWFVLEWHGFLAQNASSIMSMKTSG